MNGTRCLVLVERGEWALLGGAVLEEVTHLVGPVGEAGPDGKREQFTPVVRAGDTDETVDPVVAALTRQPVAKPRYTQAVTDDRHRLGAGVVTHLRDELVELVGHLGVGRTAVAERYRPEFVTGVRPVQEKLRVWLPVTGVALVAVDEDDRRALDTGFGVVKVVAAPAAVVVGVPGESAVVGPVVGAVDTAAVVAPTPPDQAVVHREDLPERRRGARVPPTSHCNIRHSVPRLFIPTGIGYLPSLAGRVGRPWHCRRPRARHRRCLSRLAGSPVDRWR